jgi:hypothetical protein
MITSHVDPKPENTPPEVVEREARRQALLRSQDNEDLPPDEDMDTDVRERNAKTPTLAAQKPIGTVDPLLAFADLLKTYGEPKQVKIFTPIGSIVLKALHVSINATSVGIILSKDDMHLEPAFGTEFNIEIDGRAMTVIYGGGLFTFRRIPVIFLSFFVVTADPSALEEERRL